MGNESDVGNIDFELQLLKDTKFFAFIGNKMFVTLQTKSPFTMGLGPNCSIFKLHVYWLENSKLKTIDKLLIPLDRVTYFLTKTDSEFHKEVIIYVWNIDLDIITIQFGQNITM